MGIICKSAQKRNLLLYSETWILAWIIISAVGMPILLSILFFKYLKLPLIWIVLALIVYSTRKSYSFKMGLGMYNFAAFLAAYLFGYWFAFSLILVALYFVARARPEQLQGLLVNAVLLNILAGISVLARNIYGLEIIKTQFIGITIVIVTFGILIDFLFAARFTAAAKPRLFFSHCLEFMVNYYVILNFGFLIFKLLLLIT